MPKKRGPNNPFYVLLVLLGIAFTVTACAYGVMAFRAVSAHAAPSGEAGARLLDFMRHHGVTLLLWEIGLLAVNCFAAMATDRYWSRREVKAGKQEPPEETG